MGFHIQIVGNGPLLVSDLWTQVLILLNLMWIIFNNIQASNTEMMWVLRLAVVGSGAVSTLLAITVNNVMGLLYLDVDACLFVLLPGLLCAVYVPWSNAWGSLAGVVIGVFLRVSAGEPLLGLPALIKYPFYVEDEGLQMFPYKTLSCLVTTLSIILVSWISGRLYARRNRHGPERKDEKKEDQHQETPLMDNKSKTGAEKNIQRSSSLECWILITKKAAKVYAEYPTELTTLAVLGAVQSIRSLWQNIVTCTNYRY